MYVNKIHTMITNNKHLYPGNTELKTCVLLGTQTSSFEGFHGKNLQCPCLPFLDNYVLHLITQVY